MSQLLDGLLPWQHLSYEELHRAFAKHNAAVDASEMGTGKTYKACRLLSNFDAPQLIVCPLSVVPTWERVLAQFGGEADVINYEQVKLERSPYGEFKEFKHRGQTYRKWEWHPGIDTVLFDEVHRCGGEESDNSLLLRGAKSGGKRVLGLSGTLAESPLQLKALGYLLDLYGPWQPIKTWKSFLACNGVVPTPRFGYKFTGRGFPGANAAERQRFVMSRFRSRIFPERGTRLTIDEIGSDFPESQITAELYQTKNDEEINRLYNELAAEVERWKLRSSEDRDPEHPLTKKLRERQFIELFKVPIFEDLAKDSLAGGHSVVVFTNFLETLDALAKRFPDAEIFYGGMTKRQRHEALERFQSAKSRMIIVQIDSGGTGVDLHDLLGGHMRHVYISPGYSAKNLLQALKRVQRAEAKTKSIQRMIFVKGTVEEEVHGNLHQKVDNLNCLQDGDLVPNCLRLDIPLS